jgi:hypothetical protein
LPSSSSIWSSSGFVNSGIFGRCSDSRPKNLVLNLHLKDTYLQRLQPRLTMFVRIYPQWIVHIRLRGSVRHWRFWAVLNGHRSIRELFGFRPAEFNVKIICINFLLTICPLWCHTAVAPIVACTSHSSKPWFPIWMMQSWSGLVIIGTRLSGLCISAFALDFRVDPSVMRTMQCVKSCPRAFSA